MLADVTVIPKGQDEGKHKPHFPSWKQAPLRRVQEAGQKLMDFMAKMRKQERVSVPQDLLAPRLGKRGTVGACGQDKDQTLV